jgi:hypothetical protein
VALKVSVVPLRLNLFSSAPPAIRKSAPPLLVSYHLEGSTSNKDFSINSKGELSIKAKVDKKQKGDYYFSISASDPQGNKSKINFFI